VQFLSKFLLLAGSGPIEKTQNLAGADSSAPDPVAPLSGTSSQKWPKTYLAYDVNCKKKTKPKTKTFFSLHIQGLAESFEGLNSSLAQSAEDLCG